MLNVEAIDSRLRTLDSDLISSPYQKRLRSTQERLRTILDSLPNSVDLYTATSNDIRKFLVWSDTFGKTKVHSFDCPSLGQQGSTICSCPMRLSAGSVQNLLQQVTDIYMYSLERAVPGIVMITRVTRLCPLCLNIMSK